MPIETTCPGCSRKLRVGDEFAGKQARCPICNEIYSVLGDSESTAAPSSDETWRLKTPEGQIYGPVSKAELDKWVTDGRVTAECYLASDESNWDLAEAFYPVLREAPVTVHVPAGTGATAPTVAVQTGGSAYAHTTASTTGRRYRYAAPHRGGLILALAIISWVVGCPIFGLFAWIMGSGDLREMRLGRMDPSGMGLTQAGQIIGMIHAVLVIVVLVVAVFFMLMAVAVS